MHTDAIAKTPDDLPRGDVMAEVEDEARALVSIQIPWVEATGEEAADFVAFLEQHGFALPVPPGEIGFRHAPLSFYPDLAFFELTTQHEQDPLYVVIDPDAGGGEPFYVLDTTNGPIYRLNEQFLRLDAGNVRQYVAFFFSCVAGPHGRMPIIERLEVPESAAVDDDETLETLEQLKEVLPPRVLSETSGGFVIGAALAFQGAIFRVRLQISPIGHVIVENHELVLAAGDPDEDAEEEAGEIGAA